MTNTTRSLFSESSEGITTITQCIIPPASKRLRHSVLENMANLLLMLSSFYERTDLATHPRICVFINNVSKHEKTVLGKQVITWQDFIT